MSSVLHFVDLVINILWQWMITGARLNCCINYSAPLSSSFLFAWIYWFCRNQQMKMKCIYPFMCLWAAVKLTADAFGWCHTETQLWLLFWQGSSSAYFNLLCCYSLINSCNNSDWQIISECSMSLFSPTCMLLTPHCIFASGFFSPDKR